MRHKFNTADVEEKAPSWTFSMPVQGPGVLVGNAGNDQGEWVSLTVGGKGLAALLDLAVGAYSTDQTGGLEGRVNSLIALTTAVVTREGWTTHEAIMAAAYTFANLWLQGQQPPEVVQMLAAKLIERMGDTVKAAVDLYETGGTIVVMPPSPPAPGPTAE